MDPSRRKPSGDYETTHLPSSGAMRTVTRLPGSGQYPLHYTRMREVLLHYLSPILVDSVLEKALRARNVTPALLSPHALGDVASDIMIGLRLFVAEEDLPHLMLELAEVLETLEP